LFAETLAVGVPLPLFTKANFAEFVAVPPKSKSYWLSSGTIAMLLRSHGLNPVATLLKLSWPKPLVISACPDVPSPVGRIKVLLPAVGLAIIPVNPEVAP